MELLEQLFPCSQEEIKNKRFIINSVEEVKVSGSEIVLVGEIYSVQPTMSETYKILI